MQKGNTFHMASFIGHFLLRVAKSRVSPKPLESGGNKPDAVPTPLNLALCQFPFFPFAGLEKEESCCLT